MPDEGMHADPPDPGELEELEQLERREREQADAVTEEQDEEIRSMVALRRKRKPPKDKPRHEAEDRRAKARLFPAPYSYQFSSDATDVRSRPAGFFDYWARLYKDAEFRDRVVVYAYRLWPVMKDGCRQVAKLYEPITEQDVLKLFGCGDYLLKLNDAMTVKGLRHNITNCKMTKVGDYNLTDHPPLLDVDGLDVNNVHNERYILWCESRGIRIPGREKAEGSSNEEEEMSKVTKVLLDQYAQLTEKLAKSPRKRGGASAVVPMVEVIKSATEGANQIMQRAYERTAELQAKAQDPAELLGKTLNVVKELMPQQHDPSGVVSSYLQAVQAMSERMMQVNRDYVDRMVQMTHERMQQSEKQMTALLEAIAKKQEQAAANPAPVSGQPSIKDVLKDMAELKDQLREVLGLDDDRGQKSSGWQEYLPDILKALTVVGTSVAAAMHNFAVAKTGQGQPTPAPVLQQEIPAAQQPELQQPQQQQQQQQQEETMLGQYHNLLGMLRPGLLKAFQNGESGADYAEQLIEFTDAGLFGPAYSGRQIYDAILEAGEMSVATVIKTYPPIWDVVKTTPQKWERFLHEFFIADQIWEQEDQAEAAAAGQPKVVEHPAAKPRSKKA